MLKGSLVAIVTPMQPGGALDLAGLRKLIDWHIGNGTNAVVVVGTTGESPTVDVEEHCLLIKTAVDHTAGRIPVIAGTGGNATAEAIELAGYAKRVGASASLSVVPYYNKPTQEGLYRHFRSIAEKVDLPVILYNVPSRTSADLANDTVLRLAQVPGIIGLKDATSDLGRASELIRALAAAGRREFAIYSGDADVADVRARARRRHRRRARSKQPPAAAAPEALRGSESDSGEMGARGNGYDRRRAAAAADSARGSASRCGSRSDWRAPGRAGC